MAQMRLDLPDEMVAWAEARVAAGEFASVDDVIADLIARDRAEEEAMDRIRAEVAIGIASPKVDIDIRDALREIMQRNRKAA